MERAKKKTSLIVATEYLLCAPQIQTIRTKYVKHKMKKKDSHHIVECVEIMCKYV